MPETYGPEWTSWPPREEMPVGSEWDFSRNEWGKRVTERYVALGGRDAGWLESRTGHRIASGAFDPEFGDTLRRVYPAGAEVTPKDEPPALDRLSVMSGLGMISRRARYAYALMGDGKTTAAVEAIDSIEAELAYIRAKLREGGVIP